MCLIEIHRRCSVTSFSHYNFAKSWRRAGERCFAFAVVVPACFVDHPDRSWILAYHVVLSGPLIVISLLYITVSKYTCPSINAPKSYTCDRDKENDIICFSLLVSRKDCIFFSETMKICIIADLRSKSNDIFINGEEKKRKELISHNNPHSNSTNNLVKTRYDTDDNRMMITENADSLFSMLLI